MNSELCTSWGPEAERWLGKVSVVENRTCGDVGDGDVERGRLEVERTKREENES